MSKTTEQKPKSNDTTTSPANASVPVQSEATASPATSDTTNPAIQPASKPLVDTPAEPDLKAAKAEVEGTKSAPATEVKKEPGQPEGVDDIEKFFGQKAKEELSKSSKAEDTVKAADIEAKKTTEQPVAQEVELLIKNPVVEPTLGRVVLYTPEISESIYDPKRPQFPAHVVGIDEVNPLTIELVVLSPSLRTPAVARLAIQHKSEAKEGAASWDWPVIVKK